MKHKKINLTKEQDTYLVHILELMDNDKPISWKYSIKTIQEIRQNRYYTSIHRRNLNNYKTYFKL